jgi:hypothetical protein
MGPLNRGAAENEPKGQARERQLNASTNMWKGSTAPVVLRRGGRRPLLGIVPSGCARVADQRPGCPTHSGWKRPF